MPHWERKRSINRNLLKNNIDREFYVYLANKPTSLSLPQVEEIFNFDQSDLVEEDVMLLDAGHSVFIWYVVEIQGASAKT